MRQYRIASIPADGIGPEVISAGLEVLDAVAARTAASSWWWTTSTGARTTTASTARSCRPTALAWLRTADAIYFGAVGDPNIPDNITLWGLRLPICQGLRPVRQRAPDPHPARRHLARCATSGPATWTG